VLTHDDALASKARLLREYGWSDRYVSSVGGWNSRLDEIQASILRVKLRTLDRDNSKRAELAEIYRRELNETSLELPIVRDNALHVYHLYVVRSRRRDALKQYLSDRGVGALVHYPLPVHLQPAYTHLHRHALPETERSAKEVLSLPMYPELPPVDVHSVAKIITAFERGNG
jgi:dTDP-4-amino-4,6-dideoxygalactose transaminase